MITDDGMLTEIKVIRNDSLSPPRITRVKSTSKDGEWEREDKALLELWPDSSPSNSPPLQPKQSPPSPKRLKPKPPPSVKVLHPKKRDWVPSKAVRNLYAKLLQSPRHRNPRKPPDLLEELSRRSKSKSNSSKSKSNSKSSVKTQSSTASRKKRKLPPASKTRAVTQDPSFDREHWRRGSVVQIFDKFAKKWVEGAIGRVEARSPHNRGLSPLDKLHIMYKPAKVLKGAWQWKDHKPVATKRGRLRRVSAIKEDEPSETESIEWEASVILRRNSRRLRPAIRVVWDPDLQSYLHEEPEECSSSEEEPEEYSSGEEAEQFWTNFQSWQGPDSESSQARAPTEQSNGDASCSKNSKSRHTHASRHTQETFRSQTAQSQALTLNTNHDSIVTPSQGCSSTLTYQGFHYDEEPEEEPTESDSE